MEMVRDSVRKIEDQKNEKAIRESNHQIEQDNLEASMSNQLENDQKSEDGLRDTMIKIEKEEIRNSQRKAIEARLIREMEDATKPQDTPERLKDSQMVEGRVTPPSASPMKNLVSNSPEPDTKNYNTFGPRETSQFKSSKKVIKVTKGSAKQVPSVRNS